MTCLTMTEIARAQELERRAELLAETARAKMREIQELEAERERLRREARRLRQRKGVA